MTQPQADQKPVTAPQTETKKTYDSNSLGSVISKGESGSKGYNAYNQGTAGHSGPDRDFSKLTLGEVMKEQSNRSIFAVGKYQMIPNTMKSAVETLKLDPNQKFTPELQEKIFAEYLAGHKRPQIKDYITGNGDLGKAHLATAQEWAAVAAPGSNRSYYDGSAGNAASVSGDQIRKSLEGARKTYQDLVAKGVDPQEAYARAVSGATDQPKSTTATPIKETTTTADKPTKYAVIAVGTNDFANPSKTKQNTLDLIQHAKAQGLTPIVIPPNANDPRFKAVSDEVRKAAQEAGVQIREGKYGTKDPLHLTTQDAKDIRNSYPGAVHLGDSNAVRISGGPTSGAEVGATTDRVNKINNVQSVVGNPGAATATTTSTAPPAGAPAAGASTATQTVSQTTATQSAPTPPPPPPPPPAGVEKAPATVEKAQEPQASATPAPSAATGTPTDPKPPLTDGVEAKQYGGEIPAPADGAYVVSDTTGDLVEDLNDQQGHKETEHINSQNTYVDESSEGKAPMEEPSQAENPHAYIHAMMQELTTASERPYMTSSYERAIKKATFFNEEGDQTIGGHFSFGSTTVNNT
jgi:hypothetical protein